MAKVLGYARISTNEGQDIQSQKAKLEKLGAVVVFTETGNGSSLDGRDQLEAAIRLLEPGDELLCLHPDRLARDTRDLLTVAKRVVERGAILKIDDPKIVFDGTDMMGEVLLTIFGLVGSVEKYFSKARQRRGIEAAKLRGVYKGRPATVDAARIKELHQQGLGPSKIAKTLQIGRSSVYRALAVFRCPNCKAKKGVAISYGYPSEELFEAAERNEAVLGGCMHEIGAPDRQCLDCGHQSKITQRT